jgi:2-C-methyl-D-erythritol 2,4-cyclodiphosphate synthase
MIPGYPGLLGHSDGDAICHAVTDAILGAAGEGDIGGMFPDDREANRGRSSIEMLKLSVERIAKAGYRVAQVDVVVVTEEPRIGPHRAAMQQQLSAALGIAAGDVSVKGKSNEGMGWIGRGEGLACMAVATLVQDES